MSREATIAERLRRQYPADRWAFLRQVQSAPGARVEGVRVADVIAVALWPSMGPRVEFIEIKDSTQDLDREGPEKSAPFARYATRRYIAVSSPWQRVVPSKDRLPQGFGLWSCGTGRPRPIVPAHDNQGAEPLPPFALCLLRAAQREAMATSASAAGIDIPMVAVTRPYLSRNRIGLGCGHAVTSLAKVKPDRVPCEGCLLGWPADAEMIEAAIADAGADQLDRFAALIAARRAA
jgi:hypothetical protein